MPGLRSTRWRVAAYGLGVGGATFCAIGLPTAVVPNPLFARMIPTRPQDYLFLGLTTLLATLLGATYALPSSCPLQEGKFTISGLLSFLAIGCPVCNKLVVLLLGASGALTFFAPLQPVLAGASLLLLGYSLYIRLESVGVLRRRRSAPGPV
jgi:hypothetical protein